MTSKKTDYVLNPKTSRMVKIGGKVYRRLVKQGILENTHKDENILFDYAEDMNEEDVEKKRLELSKSLPKNEYASRGSGRKKGKLIKKTKKLSQAQLHKFHKNNTKRVVKENLDELKELEDLSDAEIDRRLEELLSRELLHQPRKIKRSRRAKNEEYEEVKEEEGEGEESEEEEEEEQSESEEEEEEDFKFNASDFSDSDSDF